MPAKATPAKAATTEDTEPVVEQPVDPSRCVVDDGRCVGRAVNGRVCSYHAMTHRSDGSPR